MSTKPKDFLEIPYTIEHHGKDQIANFQDVLPHPIDLNPHGIWKMALTSVIFPNPKLGMNRELWLRNQLERYS